MERRRKCVYGPTLGKKAVIFLNDVQSTSCSSKTCDRLDMLIRQCTHTGGIFGDRDNSPSIQLVDINFLATCQLVQESISEVLDHFAPILLEPTSIQVVTTMFNRMMLWHLDARGFAKEFDSCIDQLIDATVATYRQTLDSHVTSDKQLSILDLFRCIHGLLLSVPETTEDVAAIKRLWLHETFCVLSDPLASVESAALIGHCIENNCQQFLEATVSDLLAQLDMGDPGDSPVEQTMRSIFFCDFSDPKSDSRSYVEVVDMEHLHTVVKGYVTEYNNMNKRPMHDLVVFNHFIRNMAKASRVLKQPAGHLVLIANQGVGRHSLARITAHASDCHVHQFEPSSRKPYSYDY